MAAPEVFVDAESYEKLCNYSDELQSYYISFLVDITRQISDLEYDLDDSEDAHEISQIGQKLRGLKRLKGAYEFRVKCLSLFMNGVNVERGNLH